MDKSALNILTIFLFKEASRQKICFVDFLIIKLLELFEESFHPCCKLKDKVSSFYIKSLWFTSFKTFYKMYIIFLFTLINWGSFCEALINRKVSLSTINATDIFNYK